MYLLAAVERAVHENEKARRDSFYPACCEEAGGEPGDLCTGGWEAGQARAAHPTGPATSPTGRAALPGREGPVKT